MKKFVLFSGVLLTLQTIAFSQSNSEKTVLTGQAAADLLSKISIDSASMLQSAGGRACNCMDSVNKTTKNRKQQLKTISDCIDAEVSSYQLSLELLKTIRNSGKDQNITLATNKNSDAYKSGYYQIERWLNDSCASLRSMIRTNDEANENSFSKNPDAYKAYEEGVDWLKTQNYKEAIPWFEKAVRLDPQFVFAWDNLGISYRQTGELEKAKEAYLSSLKVDPAGHTALQNLPVVYLKQKKSQEAIDAYLVFLKQYPGDPEVYYGIGLVYYQNLQDMEKALDNMCKAYNIYVSQKSPYRSDAEKVIQSIYQEMKNNNKEDAFHKILKENNIRSN